MIKQEQTSTKLKKTGVLELQILITDPVGALIVGAPPDGLRF